MEINFNTVNEISKVRTRELCLCLAPFVFLGSVVLTSLIYVTRECNRILFRGWASVNSIKKIRVVVEERWTWRPSSLYLQLQLQFLSFFSRTFVNTANFARKEILKLTESLTRWESCDIYQYCNSYHKFSRRIRRRRRRLVWTAEILLWKKKTIHVVLISLAVWSLDFLFLRFVCSQARHQVPLAFAYGEKIKRPRGRGCFVADGRYELISHWFSSTISLIIAKNLSLQT